MDRDETGKDGVLIVNGEEFAFTNVDYSIDWNDSTSDYNDSPDVHHRAVGKDSGGTIEVEGSSEELKQAVMLPDGTQREDIRIQMTGSEGGDRFTQVNIISFGREYPGGDVTTTELDWVASKHRPIGM